MKVLQTAERISHQESSDNFVFQRSILAYYEAAKRIQEGASVIELGTGSGYGIEIIAPRASKLLTLDKHFIDISPLQEKYPNVEFQTANAPDFSNIPSDSFDYFITFQVIEHIQNDVKLVEEMHRVLKPGGKLILTTPNIKMSLTRNPWHIREYTVKELETLLLKNFQSVDTLGVFGNETVEQYYQKNKESVEKITRFDIFNFQYNLPRQILQIPYDILNRYNRRKLRNSNTSLSDGIKMEDYFVKEADDKCFDLFYIAEKKK